MVTREYFFLYEYSTKVRSCATEIIGPALAGPAGPAATFMFQYVNLLVGCAFRCKSYLVAWHAWCHSFF